MTENKKKILIVEDDAMLAMMYKTKLSADGYEILSADNGVEALKAIRENQLDLVMLDIIIPQVDGFEVLKEIKLDPKFANLPIILLTNLSTEEDQKKGEQLGAAAYLVKANLTPEQVSITIKKYLK